MLFFSNYSMPCASLDSSNHVCQIKGEKSPKETLFWNSFYLLSRLSHSYIYLHILEKPNIKCKISSKVLMTLKEHKKYII